MRDRPQTSDPALRAGLEELQRIRSERAQANGHAAQPIPPPPWEAPLPLEPDTAVPPFPLDVLPFSLAQFLREVAEAKAAPVDYAALPLLVLAGAAIGSAWALHIKPGWTERPALYAAIVAPPGSAKTPALKDVASPVYAEQSRLRRLHKEQGGKAARVPTVFVSDITTEALSVVLQDNPRGLVQLRDELTAWLTSMNQYKGGKGADRQIYLHAWSGEPISVHRRCQEDGPIYVAHPFLAVVGNLPPACLIHLRGEDARDDGFVDRMLFSFPPPAPAEGETWRCVRRESMAAWANTLAVLRDCQPVQQEDGEPRPRWLSLDATGRRAWEVFTSDLASQMNGEDFPDHLRGPWSKMRGYGARLALILHCLRLAAGDITTEEVDGESVLRAGRLVAYFQAHARKVYAAFEADPKVGACKRILRWVQRRQVTEFKSRDVQMALGNHSTFSSAEQLEQYLGHLSRHGYLRQKPAERSQEGGRPPAPFYEVSPVWLTAQQTQQNQQNPNTTPEIRAVPE